MDKIELKNLLFLARINAKEEEYPEIIEKTKKYVRFNRRNAGFRFVRFRAIK